MHIAIHCDNEFVIKMTANLSEADADKDVFLQLQFVIQELKHCLSIKFIHVHGHQKLDENSSREVCLNHWCDSAAKKRAIDMPSDGSQQHVHFPAAMVTFSKSGSVGRAITPWFQENLTRPALHKYL